MSQFYFDYNLKPKLNLDDFYVTESNKDAYVQINNYYNENKSIILYGPAKSGKTHLANIWIKNNDAIQYNGNLSNIVKVKQNVLIDNILFNLNEENIFHIINHCNLNKLSILITTNSYLSNYNFRIEDLASRLKIFEILKIKQPDDELIINLIIKLLHDRQIIINNKSIFQYILKRIKRTYQDIFLLIENIDSLSLEKNRELTIPLIKELI